MARLSSAVVANFSWGSDCYRVRGGEIVNEKRNLNTPIRHIRIDSAVETVKGYHCPNVINPKNSGEI